MVKGPLTAAALLIEALREAGVTHLFANFGSDHPAIIEALATDRERGIETPSVILCPHEYSALSAAHGYAAVTGEPQAVFVHTDVGTANLGGAVHNAARSRVPVFIFAGLTPYTLEGERPGSRNTHVNTLQDVPDQHALVRQYVKWSYDIRTVANVPQIVHRALQIARSAPAGPVYVTGAREVLAESGQRPELNIGRWGPVMRVPAPQEIVNELVADLDDAQAPVIITGYMGRRQDSVPKLVDVAETLDVPVIEFNAEVLNFPRDHPLHLGGDPYAAIAEADVIVALDTDMPWVHATGIPHGDAKIYIVGEDPLQETTPLWYIPAEHYIRADSGILLDQILQHCRDHPTEITRRRVSTSRDRRNNLREECTAEVQRDIVAGTLSPATVSHVLSGLLEDDAVVVNEAITAASAVWEHLSRRIPGTYFGNRGSSLGWAGGGTLGIKLGVGDRTVVSIVGDGAFLLSVPSSTYWISDRYRIPFMTVVLDNGGWNATKRNLQRQHQGGTADVTDRYWVNLQQSSDFSGIAATAGGAWGRTVTEFEELEGSLRAGLAQVEEGVSAVVTVRLKPISTQDEDSAWGSIAPGHHCR